MSERRPFCLIISSTYPAIVAAYLAFCRLFLPRPDVHNGGLPPHFGTGLVIAAVFGVLYLVGFAFLIASFVRREPHRNWAFACLALYILPVLLFLLASWMDADSI